MVVVSRHYLDSVWTRWELRSALEALFGGRDDAVLPLRCDDTELRGLRRSTAWIDVRENGETDVELLTELLLGKLSSAPVSRRRVLALGLGAAAVVTVGTYLGMRLFDRAEPGSELWHRGSSQPASRSSTATTSCCRCGTAVWPGWARTTACSAGGPTSVAW
ncbi:hypothetical protein BBK82_37340 [Lentzea guizhouensis]|uniref:TIR domain-containing protein n=1 Tax=Lentzea guizhouensis TaxID=1586287 RepID=A0A1B2HT06_9PSEU|nr:hypothetical protein BBK82_37340 [Lentzea guizhouensis]